MPATRLMAMKIAAGTIMPPTAAAIGSAARAGSRRSPGDELALEFHADDEEEDRQQTVGRPRRRADRFRCSDSGPTTNSDTAW